MVIANVQPAAPQQAVACTTAGMASEWKGQGKSGRAGAPAAPTIQGRHEAYPEDSTVSQPGLYIAGVRVQRGWTMVSRRALERRAQAGADDSNSGRRHFAILDF